MLEYLPHIYTYTQRHVLSASLYFSLDIHIYIYIYIYIYMFVGCVGVLN